MPQNPGPAKREKQGKEQTNTQFEFGQEINPARARPSPEVQREKRRKNP